MCFQIVLSGTVLKEQGTVEQSGNKAWRAIYGFLGTWDHVCKWHLSRDTATNSYKTYTVLVKS